MFGFNFERFKRTPLSKEDKRELPPEVSEKGRGKKAVGFAKKKEWPGVK